MGPRPGDGFWILPTASCADQNSRYKDRTRIKQTDNALVAGKTGWGRFARSDG